MWPDVNLASKGFTPLRRSPVKRKQLGFSAVFIGGADAVMRVLGNEPTLDMCDCAEDMEDLFICGRCRLNASLEADW